MLKKINTIAEAWNFLIDVVYKKEYDRFRIHTNKNGIRLHLEFRNKEYTGYALCYIRRKKPDYKEYEKPLYIHREDQEKIPQYYSKSFNAPTLIDALNKHISEFPGNVLCSTQYAFEFDLCDEPGHIEWTKEFKGTLKEFRKLEI